MQVPSVHFVHKNLNVFPFKSFPLIFTLHIFDLHPAFCQPIFSRTDRPNGR
jgi:hypothetical protein